MKSSLSILILTPLISLICLSQAGDLQTLFQQQIANQPISSQPISSQPISNSTGYIKQSNRLTSQSNNNTENTGITAIGIERSSCYGTCPAYSFIVQADGSFKYIGELHVEHIGEYTGEIPTYRLRRVLGAIAELDFATYQNQYTNNFSDAAAVYSMVVQHGETKVIENYANTGPASLWAIEELIDSLVQQIDWDTADSSNSY